MTLETLKLKLKLTKSNYLSAWKAHFSRRKIKPLFQRLRQRNIYFENVENLVSDQAYDLHLDNTLVSFPNGGFSSEV